MTLLVFRAMQAQLPAVQGSPLGPALSMIVMIAALSVGCQDSLREPAELSQADGWTPVAAAQDPFASERPESFSCPEGSYGPEGSIFEVETDLCHYASFEQGLLAALIEGDRIEGVLWHLALWAEDESEAHVALLLEGEVIHESRIPIPGEEAIYALEWTAPQAFPAGSLLHLHLHNHGANSWRLGSLNRLGDP